MSIQIVLPDGVGIDQRIATLTQNILSATLDYLVLNGYSMPVTSLKFYVVNDPLLPAQRSVTINGVLITGTDPASATEVLTEPLAAGATLSAQDTLSVDAGQWQQGYDSGTLYWLAPALGN